MPIPVGVSGQPTRGADPGGGIGPAVGPGGGLMAAIAALPAAFSRAHSTFCRAAMSLTPRSAISRFVSSRD